MPRILADSLVRDVALNYWTEAEQDSTTFHASLDVFTRDGKMKTLQLSCAAPMENWDNFDLQKQVIENITPTRPPVNKAVDRRQYGRRL